MSADYVFVRPNGKPYRPRTTTLRTHPWGEDDPHGCIVFGTLNTDEAQNEANRALNGWCGGTGTRTRSGWWRDGYDIGGRTWIDDEVRGRPGVMFTCENC